MSRVVAFPDPHSLARDELASLLRELTSREQAASEERRALHAQIDALRREFVDRLREEAHVVISGSDLLDPGSAGVREPRSPSPRTVRTASPFPSHRHPTLSQRRHHRTIHPPIRTAAIAPACRRRGRLGPAAALGPGSAEGEVRRHAQAIAVVPAGSFMR
jgi:hypothetical protein